jgi:hypothetical protein
MRSSASEPAKRLPLFAAVDRSPLQPIRSVDEVAAGSVIVASRA